MGDMTRLLLLLLWVGVAVSTPVDLQKRIIGGQTCKDDERQYHVKLIGNNGTHNFLCGGSLISDRWILTAAHCKGKTMTAYVGIHPHGPGKKEIIGAPPVIFEDNLKKKHDIMLLQLPNPTQIKPVDPPKCFESLEVGTMVQVAGYANETLGPNNERVLGGLNTLQCVELKIIANAYQNCLSKSDHIKEYGQSSFKLYQSSMKDTSSGDSGGGVVHKGMIYGVHAFTRNGRYGCVAPAGFVDVCGYKDWIEKTTGLKFPSKAVGQPNSG